MGKTLPGRGGWVGWRDAAGPCQYSGAPASAGGPEVELSNDAGDVHADVDGGRAVRSAPDPLADDPFEQGAAPRSSVSPPGFGIKPTRYCSDALMRQPPIALE